MKQNLSYSMTEIRCLQLLPLATRISASNARYPVEQVPPFPTPLSHVFIRSLPHSNFIPHKKAKGCRRRRRRRWKPRDKMQQSADAIILRFLFKPNSVRHLCHFLGTLLWDFLLPLQYPFWNANGRHYKLLRVQQSGNSSSRKRDQPKAMAMGIVKFVHENKTA